MIIYESYMSGNFDTFDISICLNGDDDDDVRDEYVKCTLYVVMATSPLTYPSVSMVSMSLTCEYGDV